MVVCTAPVSLFFCSNITNSIWNHTPIIYEDINIVSRPSQIVTIGPLLIQLGNIISLLCAWKTYVFIFSKLVMYQFLGPQNSTGYYKIMFMFLLWMNLQLYCLISLLEHY